MFVLAASLILLSGAVLCGVLAHLHGEAVQAAERLTASFAQVIEEQTSRTLQTVDQQLQLAARRLAEQGAAGPLGETTVRTMLREQIKDLPFVRAMWVLDAQGRIAYDSDVGNIGLSLADRGYFQIYQSQPQTTLHIGSPVRSRGSGTWLIGISRPLIGADGSLQGVVVAGLEPPYFDRLWRLADLGEGGSVALFRRSGELMMRSPFDDAAMAMDFRKNALFTQYLPRSAEGRVEETSPIDGQTRVYAYRTMSTQPGLVVVVGQSYALALSAWRQLAWLALVLWLLGSATVVTICFFAYKAWLRLQRADADQQRMAQRLVLATEAASIGVWDWDAENDRWYATPMYFTMLGYDPEEGFTSRERWIERLHPQDREAVAAKVADVLARREVEYRYEARMRHADGTYRWIGVIGKALSRNASGEVQRLVGVRMDIDQRKRAEQERLSIFERITDAFVALDRTLRYTYINPAAAALLGRAPAELIGQRIDTVFPGLSDHGTYHRMAQAIADQQPAQLEDYFAPFDRWFEVRLYPSPEGVTVYFRDVSERRRAAEELRLSEESLAITLQSIGDAVIATDTLGRVTRMNPTAERLTGWTLAEAQGLPLAEVFRIVNAQTGEPVTNPAELVLSRGEVVGLANHTTLLSRDGRQYQISDRGAPIRDGQGRIVGVVMVFSDVTEAYRVARALEQTAELLERTGETAKVGGWELDLRSGQVYFSRETCRIHEVEPPFSPSLDQALAFYTPEWQVVVRAAVQAAVDEGHPWDMEWPMTTAKGRHIWVRSQGFAVREDDHIVRLRGAFHDITERRHAEDELRAASSRTQAILDNMSDGVITVDAQGRIDSFNKAASAIFGYAPEEAFGHNLTMLMAAPAPQSDGARLLQQLGTGTLQITDGAREYEGRRQDGSVFPMSLTVSSNGEGRDNAFIGVVRDITREREAMEEIRRLAFFDLLTGLPNRRLLMDRLKQAMASSARTGQHGALVLLDLDHFKLLNDSRGHDVGDILLQQAAERLRGCVRECDTVARLGGDEFVVLLEDLSRQPREAAAHAEVTAMKILDAFKPLFSLRQQQHESTPSIGIVVFGSDHDGVDELLKKADLAMYQAKAAGRNNARFFDPEMQAAVAAHEALEKDLRRGLAMKEFVLYYQVQVDGRGDTLGAEALVRWQHPSRGLVAPGHFIPLAEETGLILPLGQWVLDSACAQLVEWAADPVTARWTMAVNVSASQFAQVDFVDHVSQALARTGADPRLLKLELTESMLVGDMEDVIRKMNQIKSQGVGFSLDDFGTGYSSLSYLKRLPLDQLKIDQSFVRDVLVDASDAVIARTIVALGQSLGLRVIAEGVETAEHRDFLAQIGCDGFQGYFFGRPAPAQTLARPSVVPD
ncbi:hypothetical protein RD110_13185 [Rhodoferax koreense]|uniref:Diguanylate cyclase n=1 Tax=Rhodoferax koreensis TaxID=1842727 RepID=A0A1P8JW80_9BURK|nr:hypothetical protein RD110_13185 [Rhodoferax koreense]